MPDRSMPARVVRFHQTGGPEVLRIEQEPSAAPGAGEVLLRVEAHRYPESNRQLGKTMVTTGHDQPAA